MIKSLLSILFIFLPACSSVTLKIPLEKFAEIKQEPMGAIFHLSFSERNDSFKATDCSFIVTKTGLEKPYEIPLEASSSPMYVELPPGKYVAEELYCGGNHRWDLLIGGATLAPFQVYPGKISLLGGIEFFVRQNRLSTRASKQAVFRENMKNIFQSLPTWAQSKVVSGYTGNAVSKKLVDSSAAPKEWKVNPYSGKNAKSPDLWPNFESCYDQEANVNLIWLGEFECSARFREGKLAKFTYVEKENTFTPAFKSCVEKTLHEFTIDAPVEVLFTFYL